jgi:hypothetical protein
MSAPEITADLTRIAIPSGSPVEADHRLRFVLQSPSSRELGGPATDQLTNLLTRAARETTSKVDT